MSLIRIISWCLFVCCGVLPAQDLVPVATGTQVGAFGGFAFVDVDGSGFPDLCRWEWTELRAYRDPFVTGGFSQGFTLVTAAQMGGGTANVLGLTDLDDDGNPEILLQVNGAPQGLWVVPTLNGQALPPGPITSIPSASVFNMVQGDFNGDGLEDLAVSTLPETRIYLRQLNPPLLIPAFSTSLSQLLMAGDFDDDGIDDLLLEIAGAFRLVAGNTSGTFALGPPAPTPGVGHRSVFAGDFDGDGDVEALAQTVTPEGLVVVDAVPGSSQLTIVAVPDPMSATPSSFTSREYWFEDLDADGARDLFDLLRVSTSTGAIRMRRVDDQGEFVGGTARLSVGDHSSLSLLDGDGDGDLDVFVTGFSTTATCPYTMLENRAIVGSGCAGAAGVPAIQVGSPYAGNLTFAVSLSDGAPGAQAFLAVSTGLAPNPGPCAPIVDLSPGALAGPIIDAGLTSATGSLTLPIPLPPGIDVRPLFAQWGVLDPQGLGTVGGVSFSGSRARGVRVF